MYLKRLFNKTENGLQLAGVKVLRANKIYHLPPDTLTQGISQGWITMTKGHCIIHGSDGDVDYLVTRGPGIYCCHCEEKIGEPNEGATPEGAAKMRKHVLTHGEGVASPDPTNPAGYRQDNFFNCVSEVAHENMTPEEAVKMEKAVRDELHRKLGDKHRRVLPS